MSEKKKQIRAAFRDVCLKRDGYKCKFCGVSNVEYNIHHIQDRTLFKNGGYCKENGITLCLPCHENAEVYHSSNGENCYPNMHPDDLYKLIESSKEKALEAD